MVLEAFFRGGPRADDFYLTGGTALAGFYLHHRRSDDLDLFTRDAANLDRRVHESRLHGALSAAGLAIDRAVDRGTMVQYMLEGDPDPDHRLVKIDLAFDNPPYFAAPRWLDGVAVDDLLAIAVNKVTALGRREPRDYLDLFVIVRSGRHRLEDLMPMAREKDEGIDELTLARDFADVATLRGVAEYLGRYVLEPVDWVDVVEFYRMWSERLLEQQPPRHA